MISTSKWEFCIHHTGLDSELTKEEFQSISTINVVDEYNRFSTDKFEFEEDVDEEEFIFFRGMGVVLGQKGGRCRFG